MKKRVLALLLASLLILSMSACGNPAGTANTGEGLGVDEIVIGFVGPITGPAAGLGLPIDEICKAAFAQINEEGGILGVPVRYVSRDDQYDPTLSITYVKELVEKEGCTLMIGSASSTCVASVLDYLTENQVNTLLCSASATELVNPDLYPYMFRTQVTNDTMAEDLVRRALQGEFQHVVLIGGNDSVGSDGVSASKKYAQQYGLTFDDVIEFTPGTADMTPVAQQIAAKNPDAIISFALGADAAKIVAALDRVGQTGKYIYLGYMGAALGNFADLAGVEPTQYVFYQGIRTCSTTLGNENPDVGVAQEWYDYIQAEFGEYYLDGSGRTWNWFGAGRAYDCIMILKYAIEQANSLDPDAIKEAIEGIRDFDSVVYTAKYNFSPTDHEAFDISELCQCYMGQYVYNIGKIHEEPIAVLSTDLDYI